MYRLLFCGLAAFAWAHGVGAQPVPARELWEFPLGAMFEPPALATEPGAGLWNPATSALPAGERLRVGVASLSAGAAQGVDGQLLTASFRRSSGVTLGLSVARASIAGLVRTDSDPQSVGSIPYNTTLLSVTAARKLLPHLTAGVAMRWRNGQADQASRNAVAADLGMVAHDLPLLNARLAVSSFLWRPGREIEDRPAVVTAADVRVIGHRRTHELRAGYAQHGVNRGARERGPFVSARFDRLEARAGYLRASAGATDVSRVRSGVALYFNRYVVGIAREEGISGLGPVYQFTLSSLVK
ncbi:MAG: hypothetical protein ACK5XT_01110 [Gemmatimonas sp.]|jgi:hypothetical protein|uniref:hypothetical protein n=1 Tax=Gemmatimonas sp. TaxID=1962908 RepID=UPI00391F24A7|nr:hypothetical protein [Gemmatimonadota bacterium]